MSKLGSGLKPPELTIPGQESTFQERSPLQRMRPKYVHDFRLDLIKDIKSVNIAWHLPPSPSLDFLRKQCELVSGSKNKFPILANVPIPEGHGCIVSQLGRIELDDEPVLPHHVERSVDYVPLQKWPIPRRDKPYPKCKEIAILMEEFREYNFKNYPYTKGWHFGALPFKIEKLQKDIKRAILDGWTNRCYVPGYVPGDDPSHPGIGLFRKKDSIPSTKDWEVLGEYTGQIQITMEQPDDVMDLLTGINDYHYSLPGYREFLVNAYAGGNEMMFINDGRYPARKNNASFGIVWHCGWPHCIVFKMPVVLSPGVQVLISYGESYWQGYERSAQTIKIISRARRRLKREACEVDRGKIRFK